MNRMDGSDLRAPPARFARGTPCRRAVDAVSRAQRLRRRRRHGISRRVLGVEERGLEDGGPRRAVVARGDKRTRVPHGKRGGPTGHDQPRCEDGQGSVAAPGPARADTQDRPVQQSGIAHARRRRSGGGLVLPGLRTCRVCQRRHGSVAPPAGPVPELLRDGRLADPDRGGGRSGLRSGGRLLRARARTRQRPRALEDRAARANPRVGDAHGVQARR